MSKYRKSSRASARQLLDLQCLCWIDSHFNWLESGLLGTLDLSDARGFNPEENLASSSFSILLLNRTHCGPPSPVCFVAAILAQLPFGVGPLLPFSLDIYLALSPLSSAPPALFLPSGGSMSNLVRAALSSTPPALFLPSGDSMSNLVRTALSSTPPALFLPSGGSMSNLVRAALSSTPPALFLPSGDSMSGLVRAALSSTPPALFLPSGDSMIGLDSVCSSICSPVEPASAPVFLL
ncbi:hypothetical protein C8R46DRAFT_1228605 [Mycena filopes]|nr:hypothetical protein C8R46DRAFT_1228605 [Mycena filopes]